MNRLIFCTLFDSRYLNRGLVTIRSLQQSCRDFHLYVVAFDDLAAEVLLSLQPANVTVIPLAQFEDPELLAVKGTRSAGEYCWTCTPSIIKYVLDTYQTDHCTYIDADMFFYSDPAVLIDEMGTKSVLITSHRYPARYQRAELTGKYCVQFMTFKNTPQGLQVLEKWRKQCLEWCYARFEDGKFGDQKYLDTWTTEFPDAVHELQHPGGGMAPWNNIRYRFFRTENQLQALELENNRPFTPVFYHFHQLKLLPGHKADLCRYVLSKSVVSEVYRPYLREMIAVNKELREIDSRIPDGIVKAPFTWKSPLVFLKRIFRNEYNVIDL